MDYALTEQFTNNLLRRVFSEQIKNAQPGALSLPEPQPMSEDQEEFLEELKNFINKIRDSDEAQRLISKFARVMTKENFGMLVNKVFEGGISWGKIFTLIVIVLMCPVNLVLNLLCWLWDYIKEKLLGWICSVGGWIQSIGSWTGFAVQ